MAKQDKSVNNFPNLRFPGFEDEWEVKKLGAVMDFKVTNSFSRENLNYEKGVVKNIHYGDIHTKFQTLFDLEKEEVPFINEEISLSRISEDFYCQEGDVVFADASEDLNDVGKSIEIVNLNGEKLLSGLHTLLGRPDQKYFYKGFNGFLFKSKNVRYQIQKESQGSKVLSINVGRISNVKLSFPSKAEQQKITSLISLIESRISKSMKTIEKLETSMRGFREKIFSQKLRFKDKNGDEFSKWSLHKLGDKGEFFSGGTPLTSNKHFYNGKIPFIKSGEINAEKTNQFISDEALRNSSAKLVEVGDLLFALYGATSGESGLSKINGAINQAILCIRTNENNIYLLNYLRFKKESILKTYLQGGQGNLSTEIIKSLVVPIPQIEEQNKIANFLYLINDKIENEKKILHEFETQKSHLLLNLFI